MVIFNSLKIPADTLNKLLGKILKVVWKQNGGKDLPGDIFPVLEEA